ncbi:MAG: 3-keto-disaccharide hydrolase [Planctomycetota bacterium]
MQSRAWVAIVVVAVLSVGLTQAAEQDIEGFGEPDAKGFITIFNGKDLTNWDGKEGLWSVKNGAIHGEQGRRSGNTFCIWRGGLITDCELMVTFRINNGNSGIQYRSVDLGNHVVSGYQAEVQNKKGKVGFLYGERGRGWLVSVGEKVVIDEKGKKKVVGSLGDKMELTKDYQMKGWNTYRIVCRGNHIQHFLNGVQTIDLVDHCLDDPDAKKPNLKKGRLKGILALQLHGGGPMWVEFKDIKIKPLNTEAK